MWIYVDVECRCQEQRIQNPTPRPPMSTQSKRSVCRRPFSDECEMVKMMPPHQRLPTGHAAPWPPIQKLETDDAMTTTGRDDDVMRLLNREGMLVVASAAVAGRKLQRSRGIVRVTQMDSIPGWLVVLRGKRMLSPLCCSNSMLTLSEPAPSSSGHQLTVNGAESSPL